MTQLIIDSKSILMLCIMSLKLLKFNFLQQSIHQRANMDLQSLTIISKNKQPLPPKIYSLLISMIRKLYFMLVNRSKSIPACICISTGPIIPNCISIVFDHQILYFNHLDISMVILVQMGLLVTINIHLYHTITKQKWNNFMINSSIKLLIS